jgi:hypothetical protein
MAKAIGEPIWVWLDDPYRSLGATPFHFFQIVEKGEDSTQPMEISQFQSHTRRNNGRGSPDHPFSS